MTTASLRASIGPVIAILLLAQAASGGQQSESSKAVRSETDGSAARAVAFDGPPLPELPDIIARDASGRTTVRAVGLTAPLRVDGQLDDAVYSTVRPISDFIQQEPVEDSTATEKTEVWVFYDRDTFYVSFRCWESQPDNLVANEMRRDNNNIFQNDHVAFFLDTFHDLRNGVEFAINPIGGRWDGQITNERQFNSDWNPISQVEVGRFDGGWTVEVAIPFKSLRYRPGRGQVWGFNARRINRAKNETSFLTRIPRALGAFGLFHASLAATLAGLEAPSGSRNLEIKPYMVSNLTTDQGVTPPVSNDVASEVGVDAKYSVTQNVTADFTYNTDFAQVEADEQQINLTRFSLFFPEKREFFLENLGLFGFGGVGATGAGTASAGDTPILFYSRRIGFNQGRAVPIQLGGRLTGRVGRFSLGILNLESNEDEPSASPRTNYSVVRVKRDLLRRSSIGLIYTGRSDVERGVGANQVFGLDGTFAFFDNLALNTYWARSETGNASGQKTGDVSYRAQLDYAGDRYGVQLEHLLVGDNFVPDIGYLRRDDIRRSAGQLRFSPRPKAIKAVRKFSWIGSMAYVEDGGGQLDTRDRRGEFGVEFQSSDRFTASYGDAYELLPQPLRIVGLTVPAGGYQYATTRLGFTFGQQRKLSGSVSAESGEFYGGHKTTFGVSQGRFNATPQLSFEPTYLGNWVSLPNGSSTTHLVGSRVTYTMRPTMFASALLQYNTGINAVSANVRLRWEYRPGSELFVVFNEQRDTLSARFPDLVNRSVIVKINRLFRI